MAKTATTKAVRKQKIKRSVPLAQVHIQATFNNTIVSFTDPGGKVLSAASGGSAGFKGSRKGTAYAAQMASAKAADKAKDFGVKKVDVLVKGIGLGREAAIRSLQNTGYYVNSIKDITGVPHNGCRPKRARRV
ncbi:30S ribosomal protein S11 [Candidatus Microgenomates bacterium]|nr:30S ribosomal protein S11 [Candidatus Microgenomates bacterium]